MLSATKSSFPKLFTNSFSFCFFNVLAFFLNNARNEITKQQQEHKKIIHILGVYDANSSTFLVRLFVA